MTTMTIMCIILIIYIFGLFFNLGIIFDDKMNNDNTIKENCKLIVLGFLSSMIWPFNYIYRIIAKK